VCNYHWIFACHDFSVFLFVTDSQSIPVTHFQYWSCKSWVSVLVLDIKVLVLVLEKQVLNPSLLKGVNELNTVYLTILTWFNNLFTSTNHIIGVGYFWKYLKYPKYPICIEKIMIFSIFWYFLKYHDIYEPCYLAKVNSCSRSLCRRRPSVFRL